jgi:hypothetical protein
MQVTPSVRLLEPLSAGGMGAVWTADHLTLHTRVVVKFMSADLASNEEARMAPPFSSPFAIPNHARYAR